MKALFKLFTIISLCLLASCRQEEFPAVQDDGKVHTCIMNFTASLDGYDGVTRSAGEYEWTDGEKLYITFYGGETAASGVAEYSAETGSWVVTYTGNLVLHTYFNCRVRYFQNAVHDNGTVSLATNSISYVSSTASYVYNGSSIKLRAHLAPSTGRIRFVSGEQHDFSLSGVTCGTSYTLEGDSLHTSSSAIPMTMHAENDSLYTTDYVYASYTDTESRLIEIVNDGMLYSKSFPMEMLRAGANGYMRLPLPESCEGWEVRPYNNHEYVDLGLPSGLRWATCNVGAENPWEYGNYYAWGEINTKGEYTEGNNLTYGVEVGDISANSEYDAATANWGSEWRMPTSIEFEELINNCTWTWTVQNEVNGYLVTGPNGNSIFLPASGIISGTSYFYTSSCGSYWTSTPSAMSDRTAYDAGDVDFTADSHAIDWSSRANGQSIRPVYAGSVYESFSYTDSAVIESGGTVQTVDDVTILVENHNGVYSMALNRLILSGMPIGDVVATGITVSENNGIKEFETEQNITITASDDSLSWMGPMLGEIPAIIRGKMTSSQLYCTISLTVATLGEVNIVFGTELNDGLTGSINGYEYVDLGLPSGLKWATCNIGAADAWNDGNYYAWGELVAKEEYTPENCTTSNLDLDDISGNQEYDAATANWGGGWRMPTDDELRELTENCIFEWTTLNDVAGYRITGPNGNSIFMPASGYMKNNAFYNKSYEGYYWSSTSAGDVSGVMKSIYLNFSDTKAMLNSEERYAGLPVRPVYGEKNAAPSTGRVITSLSQLDNNTVVNLICERGTLLYSPAYSDNLCASSCTGTLQNGYSKNFKIINDGSNYYLYSVGAGKYVNENGNYNDQPTTPLIIENTNNADYPWLFKLGSNVINMNGNPPYGVVINSWTYVDEGNSYKIIAVDSNIDGFTLDTSVINALAAGGSYTVNANTGIEWYAECTADWLKFEKAETVLNIQVYENASSEQRTAVIAFKRTDNGEELGSIIVNQRGYYNVCSLPEMTTDMNDIKWYTIRNTRSTSGQYLYWAGDDTGVKDSDAITSASFFYFTGTADACYIHNYATDMLMAGNNGWSTEGYVFNISETPHSSKAGVAIGYNGTYLNELSTSDSYTSWMADDAGSIFVIEPVTDLSGIFNLETVKAVAIAEIERLAAVSSIYPDASAAIAAINAMSGGTSAAEFEAAVDAVNAAVLEYRTNAYRALAGKNFTINTPARSNGYMSMGEGRVSGVAAVNTSAAVWQFIENNGAVNIYNPSTGRYICSPEGLSVIVAVTENQSQAGAYQLEVVTMDSGDDGAIVKITEEGRAIHMAEHGALVRWDEGSSSEWTVALYEESFTVEYVDLGLPSGVKWANCNVGASVPEEYGNYYAWGEINTKDDYSANTSLTNGLELGDISGNPQYDAARANWGGEWRLPTKAEFDELRSNCTWEWTTQNEVNGYLVTGSNGNSIFLPAAGYRDGTSLYYGGSIGYYWSSTPYDASNSAHALNFDGAVRGTGWRNCDYGKSVRPVIGGLAPSVTLTSQNGLPGVEQDDETYLFRSSLLSLSGQANKVRITVINTNSTSTDFSDKHVFFALSELAIYDAEGQPVGYTATSNADHNTISGDMDGAGLAGLNDGTRDTYFHSVWRGSSLDNDYHYIELELERDVESFSIEWSTRRSTNGYALAPMVVGVTRGTEYNP